MNRLPILAALLLAIAATVSAAAEPPAPNARPQSTPLRIGQQAPTFRLRDQNGKRINVDAAGTKAVLVFYRGYW